VYPPTAFVPLAWIGFLSWPAAVAVWLAILSAAALATLWVLGVRDPRQYVLWLATPMVLSTAAIGNATVLVVFFVALTWRWRDSPGRAAVALTAAIAIKLFVAPLVVWLLLTKRYRAAAYTVIATPLVILGAWAVIGFAGLSRYASVLSANRYMFGRNGPYLQQLMLQMGAPWRLALIVGIAAAAAFLVAARNAADLSSFTLALAASIVLAPVAWIGYLALLIVPVAVMWRRFSIAWALLLLGTYAHWYYMTVLPYTSARLSIVTLALLTTIVGLVLRDERRVAAAAQATLQPA
jgi:hypothetical protein